MGEILSGLETMGLKDLCGLDVFAPEEKKEDTVKKTVTVKTQEIQEKDYLFDKTVECVCCGNLFKEKTIRSGKARMISQDVDLRPRYENIDTLKYGVTACPLCGYAALTRDFERLGSGQAKLIKDKISVSFTGLKDYGDTYNYSEAIARHKLALANTVVKHGKLSEKAYLCLMLGWLARGMNETAPENLPDRAKIKARLAAEEEAYLAKAAEGFTEAFTKENFPFYGMDENTSMFLVAALYYETGKYEESLRWASRIITNRAVPDRIKERARVLKETISETKGIE